MCFKKLIFFQDLLELSKALEICTSGTDRNALEKYGGLSDSFSESVAPIRLQRIAITGMAALHRILSVVYEFQEASGSGATGGIALASPMMRALRSPSRTL